MGPVSLTLGDAAEKWALKIQHPPSRLDKIGVKPEWRVSVLGLSDRTFLGELERAVRDSCAPATFATITFAAMAHHEGTKNHEDHEE